MEEIRIECHLRCYYRVRKQDSLRAGERMLVLLGLLLLAVAPLAYYMATTIDAVHTNAFKTGLVLSCIAVAAALVAYFSVFHRVVNAMCDFGEQSVVFNPEDENLSIMFDDGALPVFKKFWMEIALNNDANWCLIGGKFSSEFTEAFREREHSVPQPVRKDVAIQLSGIEEADMENLRNMLMQLY